MRAGKQDTGRGAALNPVGRYEPLDREAVDDGWGLGECGPPPLRTQVTDETSRSILSWNQSPDLPFDRSINPYRGCEHGCIYCYARPSHARMGLSPGLDFESRLFAKPDAARLLDAELRRSGYRCQPVMLGANTDPYQPIERHRRITRAVLEVLSAFRHPVAITTKAALVERDLDLLAPLAAQRLARVGISLTTLDPQLASRLEPRAPTPARRLEAIRRLSQTGVPVTIMAAPMIPGLNDAELESILAAGVEAGAVNAACLLIRLPLEIADLFQDWLKRHAPDRAGRILSLIRDTRRGRLDVSAFGERMTGRGAYADLLARRFRLAVRRLALESCDQARFGLDVSRFRPPPRPGDQLSLFPLAGS